MKPEQEKWMSATAIQYTTIETPAFIWAVDVKMNPFLYAVGRDKFENGKGEMLIKLNSLINKVPSKMTATWKLDNNDWTWLKLEIENIEYNENFIR